MSLMDEPETEERVLKRIKLTKEHPNEATLYIDRLERELKQACQEIERQRALIQDQQIKIELVINYLKELSSATIPFSQKGYRLAELIRYLSMDASGVVCDE